MMGPSGLVRWVQWQNTDFQSAVWIYKLNRYHDHSTRRGGSLKKRKTLISVFGW
jgi:hypothetical protein